MIAIVDYGLGNVGSIQNMFTRCGARAVVSGDPDVLRIAEKLVLPGVGAFDTGMHALRAAGLLDLLAAQALERRVPVLGICLGMQMLGHRSQEGSEPGLGWLDVETVRLDPAAAAEVKVPHMGWSATDPAASHPLLEGLGRQPEFYFLHGYHIRAEDPGLILASCTYGYEFPCVIAQDNLLGVQFHPEKSHRMGLALFRNFADRC